MFHDIPTIIIKEQHVIKGRGTVFVISQKQNPHILVNTLNQRNIKVNGAVYTVNLIEGSIKNDKFGDEVGLVVSKVPEPIKKEMKHVELIIDRKDIINNTIILVVDSTKNPSVDCFNLQEDIVTTGEPGQQNYKVLSVDKGLVLKHFVRLIVEPINEAFEEETEPDKTFPEYLRDLVGRLRHIPVMHGINGYDCEHLLTLARKLEELAKPQ